MENEVKDSDYRSIDQLYDECLSYLVKHKTHEDVNYLHEEPKDIYVKVTNNHCKDTNIHEKATDIHGEPTNTHGEANNNHEEATDHEDPGYETIKEKRESIIEESKPIFKLENEKPRGSIDSVISETRSERLRKLSKQLPKIIITHSSNSLNNKKAEDHKFVPALPRSHLCLYNSDVGLSKSDQDVPKTEHLNPMDEKRKPKGCKNGFSHPPRTAKGYAAEYPKRLVSKTGMENIALISNVPFEKIRLLNDTFHTLINLRWRWIVIGTVVVHFTIWLVFAVFWYITALAHYDFEPDPPKRTCVTGGKDFVTIFLASVEAQTTIGFGDRAIDEECPESIFLFIMQLILGTGLSGVLTCVVYAKLTRPEKLSRDGVGFSKKAVICMRDGRLCLMMRAWDLNYDHIISSEFTAHFVNTYRTVEGEVIRYYARSLRLAQRQFLLWPVTLVHVIDSSSPLYLYTPQLIAGNNYEITVSLKGASASMGTFTQSQTSYLPREVVWGYRFPPVVRYDCHKQKYVIDHKKLDVVEPIDTPFCCARELYRASTPIKDPPATPVSPSNFSEKVASFQLERTSSFRKKSTRHNN